MQSLKMFRLSNGAIVPPASEGESEVALALHNPNTQHSLVLLGTKNAIYHECWDVQREELVGCVIRHQDSNYGDATTTWENAGLPIPSYDDISRLASNGVFDTTQEDIDDFGEVDGPLLAKWYKKRHLAIVTENLKKCQWLLFPTYADSYGEHMDNSPIETGLELVKALNDQSDFYCLLKEDIDRWAENYAALKTCCYNKPGKYHKFRFLVGGQEKELQCTNFTDWWLIDDLNKYPADKVSRPAPKQDEQVVTDKVLRDFILRTTSDRDEDILNASFYCFSAIHLNPAGEIVEERVDGTIHDWPELTREELIRGCFREYDVFDFLEETSQEEWEPLLATAVLYNPHTGKEL